MKQVKKMVTFKNVNSFFLVLLAMALLFYCHKTPADLPGQLNPEVTILNQSTAAQVQGGIETVPYEPLLPRIISLPGYRATK